MVLSTLFRARQATSMEVALISVVLFCLPLFEAPKNVFSVLFLITWGLSVIRGAGLGLSSHFELPIAGLAAILWVAPLVAEPLHPITPLVSPLRWTLLALFALAACRLDYLDVQVNVLLAALMLGGVAAVAESFWVWSASGNVYPEFRSVGHVNHSSMYSLIPLAVGFGALFMRERWLQLLGVVAIISTLAFLPPSRSLVGGVAVGSILIVGVAVMAWRRWSLRSFALVVLTMSFVAAGLMQTPPAIHFRNELWSRLNGEDIFSSRDRILNSALAVWDRNPLLGTGWFSFGPVTSEGAVRAALAEDGQEYDPNNYAHMPHGHNLWTTILIERGLFGFTFVNVLLLQYFLTFWPLVLNSEQLSRRERGAAVAALLIVVGFVVAGMGNTTMMNEHGYAGMTIIAVVYGYLRGRRLVSQRR